MAVDTAKFLFRNPRIWDYFIKSTFDKIDQGFARHSVRGIAWPPARYETNIINAVEGEEYKLSNNHSPFFALWFATQYPEYADFYLLKEQRSRKWEPNGKYHDFDWSKIDWYKTIQKALNL